MSGETYRRPRIYLGLIGGILPLIVMRSKRLLSPALSFLRQAERELSRCILVSAYAQSLTPETVKLRESYRKAGGIAFGLNTG